MLWTIIKGKLSEVVAGTESVAMPEETVYLISTLEEEARRKIPDVRGCCRNGVSLSIVDEEDEDLIAYDLAEAIEFSDLTLTHLRNMIYKRKANEELTKLVYKVNTGKPYAFREAIVATPIWVGDLEQGRMTWNIRAVLAEGEEIALFCRLLNRHLIYSF